MRASDGFAAMRVERGPEEEKRGREVLWKRRREAAAGKVGNLRLPSSTPPEQLRAPSEKGSRLLIPIAIAPEARPRFVHGRMGFGACSPTRHRRTLW
jgi:hypothetical protein